MRNRAEQQVFFPDLEAEQKTNQILFGEYTRIGTFWVKNITQGNSYSLLPIKVSESLSFIYNPEQSPKRKRMEEVDILQTTSFISSDFDDPKEKSTDIPPAFYNWLSSIIEPQNLEEKMAEELGEEYLQYLPFANKYIEKVAKIGERSNLSNSRFFLQVGSDSTRTAVEGEISSSTIYLTGGFDEIRKNTKEDTILRIRKNKGKPSEYDAIRLTLDRIAFMAANKKKGRVTPVPKLFVFNLIDGKAYEMETFSFNFLARQIINAVNFSDMALRAGYIKVDEQNPSSLINSDFIKGNAKKIFLINKNKKQTITAEQSFRIAENCVKRIRGELPYTQRLYSFREVEE